MRHTPAPSTAWIMRHVELKASTLRLTRSRASMLDDMKAADSMSTHHPSPGSPLMDANSASRFSGVSVFESAKSLGGCARPGGGSGGGGGGALWIGAGKSVAVHASRQAL